MPEPNITERQSKYFAAMHASLERDTGKSLAEWVAIARSCPETRQWAQLKWLKENHGLLQNHGIHVLSEAFPREVTWRDADKLIAMLWTDPAATLLFHAVDAAARKPNDVIQTARKGYTAWSRQFQFAAARPIKGGKVMLGLALAPDASPRLEPPRNEGWSERLTSRTLLNAPTDVDAEVETLLKAAWERS